MADAAQAMAPAAQAAGEALQGAAHNATQALGQVSQAAPPPPEIDLLGTAMTMAGALFLIIGLLVLGFWLVRRFGPQGLVASGKGTGLRLVGRMMVGHKQSVCVVDVEDRRLVLGVSEHNVTLLTELGAGGTQSGNVGKSFEQALHREAGNDEQKD